MVHSVLSYQYLATYLKSIKQHMWYYPNKDTKMLILSYMLYILLTKCYNINNWNHIQHIIKVVHLHKCPMDNQLHMNQDYLLIKHTDLQNMMCNLKSRFNISYNLHHKIYNIHYLNMKQLYHIQYNYFIKGRCSLSIPNGTVHKNMLRHLSSTSPHTQCYKHLLTRIYKNLAYMQCIY